MDILGELIDVSIKQSNKGDTLAKVVWKFEKGELKWGRISKSTYGGYWVQLPKFLSGTYWVSPLKILDSSSEKYLSDKAIQSYEEMKLNESEEIDISEIDL